jgi:hypothetical protein
VHHGSCARSPIIRFENPNPKFRKPQTETSSVPSNYVEHDKGTTGLFHLKKEESVKMRNSRSSERRSMLIFLLWISLFLDVLESFTIPTNNRVVGVTSSSTTTTTLQLLQNHVDDDSLDVAGTQGLTLTIPPFLADDDDDDDTEEEDGYPSPLHKIHIQSLMTEDEARHCCQVSVAYAKSTGRWQTPDSVRHQSYSTCDFPVEDCDELQTYLEKIDFDGRLFRQLSELYTIDPDDMEYLDLFVAHYQARDSEEDSPKVMDRLEAHRDGSLLSFSLLLNSPDDFTGGGTFYDALRDVEPDGVLHAGGVIRPKKAGDVCLHSGKILHGADVVTSGSRTVLVGFIDVNERCMRPGVLAEACTDFGRVDVAAFRHKRQAQKHHKGWVPSNGRWLQGSHSHFKGFVPAFESVVRRADPEYQRLQRLEAEDTLLRQILLPEDERANDFLDGDITIL